MTVSLALSFFGYQMSNQTECNKNGKQPTSQRNGNNDYLFQQFCIHGVQADMDS